MLELNKLLKLKRSVWELLRSPRAVAFLKLGAAVVGVIQAIDELYESPSVGKKAVGFRVEED